LGSTFKNLQFLNGVLVGRRLLLFGEAVIEDLTEVLDNKAYRELFVLSKQE
jgi:hypothetical protein